MHIEINTHGAEAIVHSTITASISISFILLVFLVSSCNIESNKNSTLLSQEKMKTDIELARLEQLKNQQYNECLTLHTIEKCYMVYGPKH